MSFVIFLGDVHYLCVQALNGGAEGSQVRLPEAAAVATDHERVAAVAVAVAVAAVPIFTLCSIGEQSRSLLLKG